MIDAMKLGKAIKTGMKVYKTLDKMSGRNEENEMDTNEKRESAIHSTLMVLVSTIEKMREKIASLQITLKKKKNEDEEEFEERCQEKRDEKIEKICGYTYIVFRNGIIKAVGDNSYDYDGILVSDMDILAHLDEICNPEIDAGSVAQLIVDEVEDENWEHAVGYDTTVKRFKVSGVSANSTTPSKHALPPIPSVPSLPAVPGSQVSSTSSEEASANKIAFGCTLFIFVAIASIVLWLISIVF